MILRLTLLLAIALAIGACQPLRSLPAGELGDQWQVSGKLALRASAESIGGKRNQTLQFNWQQHGDDYRLQLRGTLGFGQVLVTSVNDQLSLYRGGKLVAQAGSAEQLLLDSTGWALPVSLLRHWATGQPAPDRAYQRLGDGDDVQRPGFSQAGWRVTYPGKPAAGTGLRPSRMRAEQPGLVLIAAFHSWLPLDGDLAL